MIVHEIPTLHIEILERIVLHNIQSDPVTAFKTALAFRKQMCAMSQNGIYPTIYKSIIPKIDPDLHNNGTGYGCNVHGASMRGCIYLLQWWWRSTELTSELLREILYIHVLRSTNIETLQWWEDTRLVFTPAAIQAGITWASKERNIEALKWWRKSKFDFLYDEGAIDYACRYGKIDSLDWWKANGLPLKYTTYAMDEASAHGHVDVLNWWKNSGLVLKYTENVMDGSEWLNNYRGPVTGPWY